jgi:hypothetical protein
MEAPPNASKDMSASWQPGWQAIDGGFILANHHTADAALEVDPVQATVLVTDVLRSDLILGLEAPEVPIYIIRWTKIGSHGVILL